MLQVFGLLITYCYKKANSFFTDIINKFDEVLLNETMEKYENKFVNSSNSPLLKKVDQVLRKLIESNKDFVEDENFDLEWACSVLDDDKLDLFVIDEMKFIITTKAVLQLCQNEHQLAYVVANALAHFLLKHKREPVSTFLSFYMLNPNFFLQFSFQILDLIIYGLVTSYFTCLVVLHCFPEQTSFKTSVLLRFLTKLIMQQVGCFIDSTKKWMTFCATAKHSKKRQIELLYNYWLELVLT